jgi:hypothetical protein
MSSDTPISIISETLLVVGNFAACAVIYGIGTGKVINAESAK